MTDDERLLTEEEIERLQERAADLSDIEGFTRSVGRTRSLSARLRASGQTADADELDEFIEDVVAYFGIEPTGPAESH